MSMRNVLLSGWTILTVLAMLASLVLPLSGILVTWPVALLLFLWSVLGLGLVAVRWPYQAHEYELRPFTQRVATQFTLLGAGRWLAGICFLISGFDLYALYQGRPGTLAAMRRGLLGLSSLYGLLFVLYHSGRLAWQRLYRSTSDEENETPSPST